MTAPYDPLLAAVIVKLPVDAAPWPLERRVAWLRMMAMAFEVVYGPADGIAISTIACQVDVAASGVAGTGPESARHGSGTHRITANPNPSSPRFCVDRDGFAMVDGRPLAPDDISPGTILWDERGGADAGDVTTILWRDTGASRQTLPAGVVIKSIGEGMSPQRDH